MIHVIKCWSAPFDDILTGEKRHEIRVNDRDYKKGDVVVMLEYDHELTSLTGRSLVFRIGTVTCGNWGIPVTHCVFTLLGTGYELN